MANFTLVQYILTGKVYDLTDVYAGEERVRSDNELINDRLDVK